MLTFGVYANLYVFKAFRADMLLSATLMPYGGYIFGGLIAWACRLEWTLIKVSVSYA